MNQVLIRFFVNRPSNGAHLGPMARAFGGDDMVFGDTRDFSPPQDWVELFDAVVKAYGGHTPCGRSVVHDKEGNMSAGCKAIYTRDGVLKPFLVSQGVDNFSPLSKEGLPFGSTLMVQLVFAGGAQSGHERMGFLRV